MRELNTIIRVDLEQKAYSFISQPEYNKYIGGEVAADNLFYEHLRTTGKDVPYISILSGPFCGVYPFASKCYFSSFFDGKLKTSVGGGSIASYLNLNNILGIEIIGVSKNSVNLELGDRVVKFLDSVTYPLESIGISGRRSTVKFSNEVKNDEHFTLHERENLAQFFNINGLVFSSFSEFKIPDIDNYKEVYNFLLKKEDQLTVSQGFSPSCFGCPLGCAFSGLVESQKVSLLPRCLISCVFAEPVYRDINNVFACFDAIGMSYNHEFLETFSKNSTNVKLTISDYLK